MRLINTRTLELGMFEGDRIPKYAILSHRWGEDEVLFDDMRNGSASGKESYQKVVKCCEQARKDNIPFVWIDTCCIDKSSTAELSEAINSMFKWYEDSEVCYAYLSDVSTHHPEWEYWRDFFSQARSSLHDSDSIQEVQSAMHKSCKDGTKFEPRFTGTFMEEFVSSVWFSCGWTLQELLAPRKLQFFNRFWQDIGDKYLLLGPLHAATRIPPAVLAKVQGMDEVSIAEKMSWASGRTTTRTEDRAYSLMGIFKVSMPMLYGEGNNAFVRLQEEIIRRTEDMTFLCWQAESVSYDLFATSPAGFAVHLPVAKMHSDSDMDFFSGRGVFQGVSELCRYGRSDKPFTLTNQGLSITLYLIPWMNRVLVMPIHGLNQYSNWARVPCLHFAVDNQYGLVRIGFRCEEWISTRREGSIESYMPDRLRVRDERMSFWNAAMEKLEQTRTVRRVVKDPWYLDLVDLRLFQCQYTVRIHYPGLRQKDPNCAFRVTLLARNSKIWSDGNVVEINVEGSTEGAAILRWKRHFRTTQYIYIGLDPNAQIAVVQKAWHLKKNTFETLLRHHASQDPRQASEALCIKHFWNSIWNQDSSESSETIVQRRQGLLVTKNIRVSGLAVQLDASSHEFNHHLVHVRFVAG